MGHRSCRKLQGQVEDGSETLSRANWLGRGQSGTESSNGTVKGEAPSQWFWCWALRGGNTKTTDQFPEQVLSTHGHLQHPTGRKNVGLLSVKSVELAEKWEKGTGTWVLGLAHCLLWWPQQAAMLCAASCSIRPCCVLQSFPLYSDTHSLQL